jgi:acyl carrier protein phosphodiesterase
MGSWTDLDANYPPGALTPAAAFAVALGHLHGLQSAYDAEGRRAASLPPDLPYDHDLLTRIERYLREVPIDAFLAEAERLLRPRQKLCVALNLLDAAWAGRERPEEHPLLEYMLDGLGVDLDALTTHRQTLALLHDVGLFPQ